jgi:hypothetical protein
VFGALDKANVLSGCCIVTSNVALRCGSSKHGKTFRAPKGRNKVAIIVLVNYIIIINTFNIHK